MSSQVEASPGPNTSNALCLLDEELLCLGASGVVVTAPGRAGRRWLQDWVAARGGCPMCLARIGRKLQS